MNEIYQALFSLDYPDGLIPGFRRKVDVGRGIIRKTLEIITISKNNSKLNNNLERLLKKVKKDEE